MCRIKENADFIDKVVNSGYRADARDCFHSIMNESVTLTNLILKTCFLKYVHGKSLVPC